MSGQALEEGPRSRAALVAAALAAALFAASVWVFYPGLVSYDSILQFHEAESGRFTTTHPPLMAATWRLLLPVGGGALPMLALEQLLYWAGFLYHFLLGSLAQLEPLWRAFGVAPQRSGNTSHDDHTASTVILDARGLQRIGFTADHLTPEALAHDVRSLAR